MCDSALLDILVTTITLGDPLGRFHIKLKDTAVKHHESCFTRYSGLQFLFLSVSLQMTANANQTDKILESRVFKRQQKSVTNITGYLWLRQ